MHRGPGQVSLERALSKLGLASRTEARSLIREGRVVVDGRPAHRNPTAVPPSVPELREAFPGK
ncbi:MAG TPA: S4 domain-containing protein [Thermoanaerobaculia bacterium]